MESPRDTARAAARPSTDATATALPAPAQIAKGALRRLAVSKAEPTPENYARAYAEEAGEAAPPPFPERARPLLERLVGRVSDDPALRDDLNRALSQGRWDELQRLLDRGAESSVAAAQAWSGLLDKLVRSLERGGRQWTTARKKDSLQRVLDGSRSDMQRLQQRLRQLMASWDGDSDDEGVEPPEPPPAIEAAAVPARPALAWQPVVSELETSLRAALPDTEPRAAALAEELAQLADRIAAEGATPVLALQVAEVCQRARRLFSHRHHLLEQLGALCRELTAGLAELAEEESWAKGQCEWLQASLGEGFSARGVRAASELLGHTRERQRHLRGDRERARDALKGLIHSMLHEVGALSEHTDRFRASMARYASSVEQADSLESLAGLVREMVEESRDVHSLVGQTQDRLLDEHGRATALEAQVRELEGELRRLSEEVSTDALTQIANRRGLQQAFDTERARLEREGGVLSLGLLDIDNFKRLNDSLGHTAGDQALKALASHIQNALRPLDTVARYGGEEFVVVLPGTPVDEAQQVLTRLQRGLSGSLFMHESGPVFVTFSAGVTAYRPGERIEEALERADEALYEAKRTGKNRTCLA
jgi:diguanylate cyclase